MSPQFRSRAIELSMFLLLAVAAVLFTPGAHAGMISTEAVQAPDERDRVKAMLARPEVAAEMQKMGIAPGDAARRVDAMTDAEVRTLAGQFDAMPAGGELSTQEWLLVILAILLVIIII